MDQEILLKYSWQNSTPPPLFVSALISHVPLICFVTLPFSLKGPGPPGLSPLAYYYLGDPDRIYPLARPRSSIIVASGVLVGLDISCGKISTFPGYS